ncbi:HERC1, partial [Symbiodinium pilosum]
LERQFDIDDAAAKVIMPNDLTTAMKTARKAVSQLPTQLNTEELEEVIVELRRIHQMLFERDRGPRTSFQGKHQAFQPVISWKAFQ